MKDISLLFKAPMVRATLDGSKTQTRRGINRLLGVGPITEFGVSDTRGYEYHFRDKKMRWHDLTLEEVLKACPYGQPGDRLWVRETFYHAGTKCIDEFDDASWHGSRQVAYEGEPLPHVNGMRTSWRKRPSIHMPRWASRIELVNKGVRIERLQDISEADALAEGIFELNDGYFSWPGHDAGYNTAREAYFALSASINGEAHVAKNPLVWVVEFKKVDK